MHDLLLNPILNEKIYITLCDVFLIEKMERNKVNYILKFTVKNKNLLPVSILHFCLLFLFPSSVA